MKKILVFIMFASLVFSLSACGELTENNKDTTASTDAITTSAEATGAQTSQSETTVKAEPVEVEMLPEEIPTQFVFASGAGAWSTILNLNQDGSFEGFYHDSEMGSNADEYPKGTVYMCNFSGKFDNIVKVNEYMYSMTLDEITTEHEKGEEWIKDEIRYIASNPYGIHDGEEFILYLPETPVSELPENFLNWCPFRKGIQKEPLPDTLSCYGLLNVNTNDGFFCGA